MNQTFFFFGNVSGPSNPPDELAPNVSKKKPFGTNYSFNTSPICDSSAALACHINVTHSTDSEAMELPIIGFSIVIYHLYDAEVGGPLKEPLKDTFKKRRMYFKPAPHRSC